MKQWFEPGVGVARHLFRAGRLLGGDAASSLLGRPWHAISMMSGILLGVASALAALTIADTQQAQIDLRFDLQRSAHAVVQAEAPVVEGFPSAQVALVDRLEPVRSVGEFSTWDPSARVTRSAGDVAVAAPLLVADPGGIAASGTRVVAGAAPEVLALAPSSRLAWVGAGLAGELGLSPDGSGVGDAHVVVGGVSLSVAGIVENSAGFDYAEQGVLISRHVAVDSFGAGAANVRLVAHVRPGSARAVAEYATGVVDPMGELALRDVTPADGERLVSSVGGDLRLVGAALGAFVGLVGMIAIANTLMMSVHHRLRELGLRSAMGWGRSRIALLVLTESAVAGLVAGVLGSALGVASAAAWCGVHGWTLVMWPALPWVMTFLGVVASLAGAIVPAMRAASITPLEAMRS